MALDPFIGSGTTAVAAKLLGRLWIGIEKDATRIQVASEHINKAQARYLKLRSPERALNSLLTPTAHSTGTSYSFLSALLISSPRVPPQACREMCYNLSQALTQT